MLHSSIFLWLVETIYGIEFSCDSALHKPIDDVVLILFSIYVMPEPRLLFRFNSCIRIFASILFSVQMLLYMAIVVYAPSIALIQVSDIETFNIKLVQISE